MNAVYYRIPKPIHYGKGWGYHRTWIAKYIHYTCKIDSIYFGTIWLSLEPGIYLNFNKRLC
jgi:hypothetical protein